VILGLRRLTFTKFRSRVGSHRAQTGLQLAGKQKTPPSSGVLIRFFISRVAVAGVFSPVGRQGSPGHLASAIFRTEVDAEYLQSREHAAKRVKTKLSPTSSPPLA